MAGMRLVAAVVALSGQDDGGCRLADLAVAELSGRFEFVERQVVDAIRREAALKQQFAGEKLARKLRLTGADLFAAIETLPGGGRQLTVFESNCGFRLKQRPLPADDAAAVRATGEALAAAVNWNSAPESVRFVSVAGVRNNLHYSLKERAKAVTNTLMLRTGELDMMVLERDYLIELLRERSLAGRWEKAVTASEVLHFELNPGATAKQFSVVVCFTDPAGKIVFRREFTDGEPDGLAKMFNAIAEYLKTPRGIGSFDRKTEAARFAREAELARGDNDPLNALKKQFAAFALDEDNLAYLTGIRCGEVETSFPWLMATLEYLAEKPELLNDLQCRSFVENVCRILWRDGSRLTPAERKSYWEFLARNRDLFLNADFDPDRRKSEFGRARNRLRNEGAYWYPDKAAYVAAGLADWNAVLASLGEERRPAKRKWQLTRLVYEVTGPLFEIQKAMPRKQLTELTTGLIRQLDAMNIPELKPLAAILSANALLYSRDYTDERALVAFADYLRAARETQAGLPNQCTWYDHEAASRYPGLLDRIQKMATADELPSPAPVSAKAQPAAARLWPDSGEERRILASTVSDDLQTIVFLTRDEFDYQVMRLGPDGKTKLLATFPLEPNRWAGCDYGWRISCGDGGYLVYTGEAVFPGSSGDGPLRKIGMIPFRINAAWMGCGRIFVLGDSDLVSFDYSGKDRKAHFSASQEGKSLAIQKEFPGLKAFYGSPGGDADSVLIFFSGGRNGQTEIRRFRLGDGSCETLAALPPGREDYSQIDRFNGSLFWYYGAPDCVFGEYYFRYDISANRLTVPVFRKAKFSSSNCLSRLPDLSHSFLLNEGSGFGGAFLMAGNSLFITGILPSGRSLPGSKPPTASAAILVPGSEPHMLPAVNGLYPAPDGKSVIAVGFDRIERLSH